MNKNITVFILLSIGFGLGAVFLAKNWLDDNDPKELLEGQGQVVSINVPLATGAIIEAKHLSVITLPESLIPKGSVTKIEDATGMVARHKLFAGDILHTKRVAKKGEGSSLASLIGTNMRAVSIRVNDVVGVSGFILPGNRVDILLTSGSTTEVILSNIKILAVDQRASNDENKPQIVRAVTIEVDLEQAESLMTAKSKGSIQLALRNPNDQSVVAVTQPDITVQEETAVENDDISEKDNPNFSTNSRNKVEVIRGLRQSTVTVSN